MKGVVQMKKEIKEFLLGTSIMWIPFIRHSTRKYTMRNIILKEVRRIMEDEKIPKYELQNKNHYSEKKPFNLLTFTGLKLSLWHLCRKLCI